MTAAILLWTDVTAARAPIRPAGGSDPACRPTPSPSIDAKDHFVTGNDLYAQLARQAAGGADAARPFERSSAEVVHSGRLALDVSPEEWLARRLRGHRQPSSADTLQTAAGKAYLVRDRATPDGGRAVVFTDITEKTRAEDALAKTQQALDDTAPRGRSARAAISPISPTRLDPGHGPGRQRQDHASAHHEP